MNFSARLSDDSRRGQEDCFASPALEQTLPLPAGFGLNVRFGGAGSSDRRWSVSADRQVPKADLQRRGKRPPAVAPE